MQQKIMSKIKNIVPIATDALRRNILRSRERRRWASDAKALISRCLRISNVGNSLKVKRGVDKVHSHSLRIETVLGPAPLWRKDTG